MSGVEAQISLVFIGKKGRTPPLKLRRPTKSPHGGPTTFAMYLDFDDDVDYLGAVEILNEGSGIYASWEVQKIVVDKIIEGGLKSHDYWTRYVFPCYGWVQPGSIRCFFEGTASLPQKTPLWLVPSRRRELEINRASIQWQAVAGLPSRADCATSADVPWDERLPMESYKPHKVATAEYLESRGMGKLLGLKDSWKDLDEENTGPGTLHGDLFIIPTETDKDGDGEEDAEQEQEYTLDAEGNRKPRVSWVPKAAAEVGPSDALFAKSTKVKHKLPFPACSTPRNHGEFWSDDSAFARQSIQGCNPCYIRRLDPDGWPETEFGALKNVSGAGVEADPKTTTKLQRMLPFGKTLVEECEAGRVFIADYRAVLGTMKSKPPPGGMPDQWHVPKPMALYYCAEDPNRQRGRLPRDLIVVAVNIDPDVEGAGQVFTLDDSPQEWALAKAHVACADAQVHLVCSWYFRTHVCMEPMAVAMRRNMSTMHPVYKLLRPYLRYLIPANVESRHGLAEQSGIFPAVLAIGDQVTNLCKEEYKRWVIQTTGLPFDLEARGFDGQEVLDEYPYRDDGKLIWQAMFAYVGEYLKLYYKEDYEVLDDTELVAWWKEVTDIGFPGYNWGDLYEIDDVPELQFALTTIMWTCGPQASALSRSMYDAYAFPPNRPVNIRGKPHRRGIIGTGSYTQFLERMPDQGTSVVMAGWAHTVSDALGLGQPMMGPQKEEWVTDTAAVKKYRQFQATLEDAQKLIDLRNEHRAKPYRYMAPEKITCGVMS